jgi:protein-tyrosine phosphatase
MCTSFGGSSPGYPQRIAGNRGSPRSTTIGDALIDLHAHVLPGVDDGPPTMDDALTIARAAAAAGTTTIVATPHVSWSWPENTAERIASGADELQARLRAAAVPLEIRCGAEVALTRALDLPDAELRALRLGGGPWLLVECPSTPSAAGFDNALYQLTARGHRIVLSHPERCPAFHRDPEVLERLVAGGMLGSVTAGSLVGRFGRQVRTFALRLLADGLAHNVASDAHDVRRRPPGVLAELAEAGLAELTDWLTWDVPGALLTGEPVPPVPPVAPKRRPLARLRRPVR